MTKKNRFEKVIGAFILMCAICSLVGCQSITKHYGGDLTVELEPNEKLEEITWKDASLWYLTRPMRDDEEPVTHTFRESSNFGALEGTVIVVESRK